jgi:galactose-1-phosphate uridylyltransferase
MEMLQHMFRYSEGNIKYLVSVEQISGLFLVDGMPEDAAKQIRDFHQKNGI